MEPLNVIENACELILKNQKEQAKAIINEHYKHVDDKNNTRSTMSNFDKLKIFVRDGFIDRYTGMKLLFPNVLRILSTELGEVFPFHPNWKMTDCHIAFWEFFPTCDHVEPIARCNPTSSQKNDLENIVTTSMKMNSAKSNFTLKELNWSLYDKGDIKNWNGMITWYLKYVENNQKILENNYINSWHNALTTLNPILF
jgi:hypothetical protein